MWLADCIVCTHVEAPSLMTGTRLMAGETHQPSNNPLDHRAKIREHFYKASPSFRQGPSCMGKSETFGVERRSCFPHPHPKGALRWAVFHKNDVIISSLWIS